MAFESDPDYDDFEFREIYPEIYGDDESIEAAQPSQNRRVQNHPMEWTKRDEQFHQEYLKWKRSHPHRVEEIKEKIPKDNPDYPGSDEPSYIIHIIIALLLYPVLIFMLIQSCND